MTKKEVLKANKNTSKKGVQKSIANQTAEFLLANPDFLTAFFAQHEDALTHIKLAHPVRGAISLHGKQLQIMQEKNTLLHDQINHMLQINAHNGVLFQSTTDLALQIITAKTLAQLKQFLFAFFVKNTGREDCYQLLLGEYLHEYLPQRIPRLFEAFKDEECLSVFDDFNYDELSFLLDDVGSSDIYNPDFDDDESTHNMPKTRPVLVAPIKKNNQIVGIFSVPVFDQERANSTTGTLFFDFVVKILNLVCLKFLGTKKSAQTDHNVMWQDFFEECVERLIVFEHNFSLDDMVTAVFEANCAEYKGFKCQHLTIIKDSINTITSSSYGLNDNQDSYIPAFITQELSLSNMPRSLVTKLSSYPSVITGKLTQQEANFLNLTPNSPEFVAIVPIWQENSLLALFYWASSAPNFYDKKVSLKYLQKIANLLNKTAQKFIKLTNQCQFLAEQLLEDCKDDNGDLVFYVDVLSDVLYALLSTAKHEFRGFRTSDYLTFMFDRYFDFDFDKTCPQTISQKLKLPASLQKKIVPNSHFSFAKLTPKEAKFLFPDGQIALDSQITMQPLAKSALFIPIWHNKSELIAIFYFGSSDPNFYYEDERQNASLIKLHHFLNDSLSKFIVADENLNENNHNAQNEITAQLQHEPKTDDNLTTDKTIQNYPQDNKTIAGNSKAHNPELMWGHIFALCNTSLNPRYRTNNIMPLLNLEHFIKETIANFAQTGYFEICGFTCSYAFNFCKDNKEYYEGKKDPNYYYIYQQDSEQLFLELPSDQPINLSWLGNRLDLNPKFVDNIGLSYTIDNLHEGGIILDECNQELAKSIASSLIIPLHDGQNIYALIFFASKKSDFFLYKKYPKGLTKLQDLLNARFIKLLA